MPFENLYLTLLSPVFGLVNVTPVRRCTYFLLLAKLKNTTGSGGGY